MQQQQKARGWFLLSGCSLRFLLYNIRTAQSPHSSYNTPECGIIIEHKTQLATCDDAKQFPASDAIWQRRLRPADSLLIELSKNFGHLTNFFNFGLLFG